MTFKSKAELRKVINRLFTKLARDAEVGPKLRDANITQRYEVKDMGLVVNLAGNPDRTDPSTLVWKWTDDVDWTPQVKMRMSSKVLNRYLQGKENVPVALARRRIETSGDVRKALALIPLTKLIVPVYRQVVDSEFPHLSA